MVDDIAPPKKKKVGRKRTTTVSAKTQTLKEKFVKAKKSATRTLNAETTLFQLKRGHSMTVKGAATLTANILLGRPYWVQLLIVGVDDTGPSVYSIDGAGGSIPDVYCATGSGSPYMYGVLEDGFREGMQKNDAIKLAARALLASGQRDAASGNGMDLAVITESEGFVQLTNEEVEKIIKSLK